MIKTLYLEVDEEVTSVVDKMKKEPASEITLVIPSHATLLQSVVNLKILASEARRLEKKLWVVTPDANGKHLATRAGLQVKSDVRQARQVDAGGDEDDEVTDEHQSSWIRDRVQQRLAKTQQPQFDIQESAEPRPARGHGRNKKRLRKKRAKVALLPRASARLALLIFVPTAIVLGLVALLVLPSATIVLTPKSEPVTRTFEFLLSNKIASESTKRAIPGSVLEAEVEDSRTFPATGQKQVGDKAVGTAKLSNSFSSSPESLAKGTKLVGQNGKTYVLTSAVTIPGAQIVAAQAVPGVATAQIEAEDVGDSFNIAHSHLTIPALPSAKQQTVSGETTTPIAGGASHPATAVSADDVAHAREQLERELAARVSDEVQKKRPAGALSAEGGLHTETLEATTDVPVDGEAAEFRLSLKMKSSLFVFQEATVAKAIEDQLSIDVPAQKHMVEEASATTYALKDVDFIHQQATLTALVQKKLVWDIDTASLQDQLRGKNNAQAQALLGSTKTLEASSIHYWPFWVNAIPQFSAKIHIRLDNF